MMQHVIEIGGWRPRGEIEIGGKGGEFEENGSSDDNRFEIGCTVGRKIFVLRRQDRLNRPVLSRW